MFWFKGRIFRINLNGRKKVSQGHQAIPQTGNMVHLEGMVKRKMRRNKE